MTYAGTDSIVLTGCGWVTPFAAGTIDDVLSAAAGTEPRPADQTDHWTVPDEFLTGSPDRSPELKRDKRVKTAAVALDFACTDAALDMEALASDRVGMVLGCALAGQLGMIEFAAEVRQQSPRFVSPIHFPQTVGNYPAGALARAYGIRGPNATIASGDASGLDAIAEARGILAAGKADVVFAGGTDALSRAIAEAIGLHCRPTSDGACLFVVETARRAAKRGAKLLATVTCCAKSTRERRLPTSGVPCVLSGTSCGTAGAIAIERWMGRCPGSLGAAAVAAAIGAARGHALPICAVAGQDSSVAVSHVPIDQLRSGDGTVRGVVFADADDAHRTTIEFTIPLTN